MTSNVHLTLMQLLVSLREEESPRPRVSLEWLKLDRPRTTVKSEKYSYNIIFREEQEEQCSLADVGGR